MVKKDEIINALKNVKDPEIGLDIVTLGLVYDIQIVDSGVIYIKMTLTTPMCHFGPQILDDVKFNIKEIKDVRDINIDLVFDPPWEPSDDLKIMMGVE